MIPRKGDYWTGGVRRDEASRRGVLDRLGLHDAGPDEPGRRWENFQAVLWATVAGQEPGHRVPPELVDEFHAALERTGYRPDGSNIDTVAALFAVRVAEHRLAVADGGRREQ